MAPTSQQLYSIFNEMSNTYIFGVLTERVEGVGCDRIDFVLQNLLMSSVSSQEAFYLSSIEE